MLHDCLFNARLFNACFGSINAAFVKVMQLRWQMVCYLLFSLAIGALLKQRFYKSFALFVCSSGCGLLFIEGSLIIARASESSSWPFSCLLDDWQRPA